MASESRVGGMGHEKCYGNYESIDRGGGGGRGKHCGTFRSVKIFLTQREEDSQLEVSVVEAGGAGPPELSSGVSSPCQSQG